LIEVKVLSMMSTFLLIKMMITAIYTVSKSRYFVYNNFQTKITSQQTVNHIV